MNLLVMRTTCLCGLLACGVAVVPIHASAQDRTDDAVQYVDRESIIAELRAQGLELPGLEPKKTRAHRKTQDALRAERFTEVLARAHEFPDEDVVVMIQLQELRPFSELKSLRSMKDEDREAALQRRSDEIEVAQETFRTFAGTKGVQMGEPWELRNRVTASIPTASVTDVLTHPDVSDVFPAWFEDVPDWTQQEYRDETYMQKFHDAGYFGEHGSRTVSGGYDRILIAMVEPQTGPGQGRINGSHLNWLAPGSFGSRVELQLVCSQNGCGWISGQTSGTHMTTTTSIAAGGLYSFGPTRAGIASSARIYAMIYADSVAGSTKALDYAIAAGADVVVFAWSTFCAPFCDPQADCGMNQSLRDAYDAGVVVVKTTGNWNETNPGVCNATYPAQRPEVISVGAVGNDVGSFPPYAWSALQDTSSRGWIEVTRGGSLGGDFNMAVTSIVGPGVVEEYMSSGCCGFQVPGNGAFGTSFAAPLIGGSAGLFREWMNDEDPSRKDAVGHIRAMILAMGNANGSRSFGPTTAWGVSEDFGAGRFMGHPPNLLAGGDFAQDRSVVSEGALVTALNLPPLPSNTTVLKVSAYVEFEDLTEVPHMLLLVQDRCDGYRTIGYDTYVAEEKIIRLSDTRVNTGVCPTVKIYGNSVPSGGSAVYTFAYWTSGPVYEH